MAGTKGVPILRWTPKMADAKTAAEAAVFRFDALDDYFTPCISFWINGAIRNSATPPMIRIQKPWV